MRTNHKNIEQRWNRGGRWVGYSQRPGNMCRSRMAVDMHEVFGPSKCYAATTHASCFLPIDVTKCPSELTCYTKVVIGK